MEMATTCAEPITAPTREDYMRDVLMNLRTEPNGLQVGYVPLGMIEIPAFQRNDTKNIAKIAENWDDSKCGYITLSAHDGHFNVIDGGHRCRAARLCGKTHILAKVYQHLTLEEEAEVFVHQQDNVTKLTPYDKFNAALLSGDRPEGRSARSPRCAARSAPGRRRPRSSSVGWQNRCGATRHPGSHRRSRR